jgi:opacity protein-like surface antigen
MGYGNADDGVYGAHRNHDTRTISGMGGGVELRTIGHIWARADYEYQKWPNKYGKLTGEFTPQGFTVGALYRFGNRTNFR